ncbi:hypothetical protein ANRL1_04122 [Anaerolineae bacterium]|nr:hypothetical protein ANRL1_04122 [Anaerolineae bacterium]
MNIRKVVSAVLLAVVLTALVAAVAFADAPTPTEIQTRINQEPFLCALGAPMGLTCEQTALLKLRWDYEWGLAHPGASWENTWKERANAFAVWLGANNVFDCDKDHSPYTPQMKNAVRLSEILRMPFHTLPAW